MAAELPAPGTVLVYDYRPSPHAATAPAGRPLRVLQWNVERNYEADRIIATIRELDVDIVFLQEVDIYCKRSGSRDHLREMAEALQMRAGFVCEFVELESVVRSERDQGGGVHGNAILTRLDAEFRALDHAHHPVNWEREGMALREPRKGRRYTIVAAVDVYPHEAPVLCYSVHLEVFCGISGRVAQFSDVLADASAHRRSHPRQLIFGDLNTMGHSIARLSGKYCRDQYRWRSFGYSEAHWWDRRVFAWHCEDGPRNELLEREGIFSEDVLRAARNPGFWDPWDTDHDITLHNKAYFGIFQGKLDWTLLMGWELDAKRMGNHDYTASDHKWLLLELEPEHDDDDDDDDDNGNDQDAEGVGGVASLSLHHTSGATSERNGGG
ncbi:Endonuclease/exonuclease/phosphatase [Thamnocephalis sphaerospora]|uniref:Endonuclease/exonuclease/phosphatase n=1 Tax=Thamnocephalis sphaerospora TaxID=78915 RepID=A0A4P9XIX4_9FUNG|nr:Endonuclease/exonuclease/phosphatase [Thamnocephalis sphaerospora]|eukprot:RKP05672.1 Endonuclease/exonuclease/phosphatase [Thamnocephalis sphaerospora]